MCGIAGLLRATGCPAEQLSAVARAMAGALASRGPDDEGLWVGGDAGVALAHRRLSVIDLSAVAHQPMVSSDGRWVVVFNGEIYDHHDLRRDLAGTTARFRGHGDTESLVEAIAVWGVERTLERVEGMFAIAAWDTTNLRLVLARDRLGEKPLSWTDQGGLLAFGSDVRALRAVPELTLTVDPRAAAAVLHRSFVPHPHSIYREVRQVPPGGLVEASVRDGRLVVRERRWWSLEKELDAARRERLDISMDEAADLVDARLADAVALRMESDVPLGAFLSGGIDSSLVASHAQRALGATQLHTFTVAMPDAGLDESAPAAAVARHLGTAHTTVELTLADALATIPTLARTWDEPFADPSMLPTALLTAAARRQLTVCLSGDGGDELFAGYNRHAAGAALQARFQRIPAALRRAAGGAAVRIPPHTIDRAGRLLPAERRPPQLGDKVHKAAALLRSPSSAWDALSQVWPEDALRVAPYDVDRPSLAAPVGALESLVSIDTASVLPDNMLVKVDRAGMAVGLEVRVPLLDSRLLRTAWQLPDHLKVAGGTGKLVLRRVAERHVPAEITSRPKLGFDPPIGRWLRGELRDWAGDLLASPRSVHEGWLDGDALRTTWSEHQSGARNHEYRLWAVLMLESWLAEHAR